MNRVAATLLAGVTVFALTGCGFLGLGPRFGTLTPEELSDADVIAATVGFPVEQLEVKKRDVFGGNYMEYVEGTEPAQVEDPYQAAKQAYFQLLNQYPDLWSSQMPYDPDFPIVCRQVDNGGSTCEGAVVLEGPISGTEFWVFYSFLSSGEYRVFISTDTNLGDTFPAPTTLPDTYPYPLQ